VGKDYEELRGKRVNSVNGNNWGWRGEQQRIEISRGKRNCKTGRNEKVLRRVTKLK